METKGQAAIVTGGASGLGGAAEGGIGLDRACEVC